MHDLKARGGIDPCVFGKTKRCGVAPPQAASRHSVCGIRERRTFAVEVQVASSRAKTMTGTAQIAQEATVAIGDTPILLRCQDQGFWDIVEQRFSGFLTENAQPACMFDVEIARPERLLSTVRELLVRNDGDDWRLERGDFRVEWNSRTGRGHIV